MKSLFWKLFIFIFKPIIPLFLTAYYLKAISYYFLSIICIFAIIFGLMYKSRFFIYIAGFIGIFLFFLFVFDKLMKNKDKILMKMRKGTITDNTSKDEVKASDNGEISEKAKIIKNRKINDDKDDRPWWFYIVQQIFGFWLWVLFYGIYAYFASKDIFPLSIALTMYVIDKIMSIKK